ncbi:hypothetical protein ABH935_005552 [Catenulispora sp. GAS73]|uniref:hypothetical protein n=1 Tax=Catenulispora sp. GAS73 TaxID=3156269 RepID=UPI003514D33F
MAVQGARLGRWIVDDAGISFAYARNIAEGHGPVVQAGAPPVEGYSNPTWVGLLAIGRLLGLFDHGAWFGIPDYVLFPKALGLLCVIGILSCFYAACLAVLPNRMVAAVVTAMAGTALAFVPTFVLWTFSGLENSFYALLVTAVAVLLLRSVAEDTDRLLSRRTAAVVGVLVALAALTRPDGLIYGVVYPAVVLLVVDRRRVRDVLRPIGFFAAFAFGLYGSYVLWRRFEFGRWLPNTAVAKAQASPSASDLNRVSDVLQYPGLVISLVAIGIVVAAAVAMPALRRPLTALLVPLALALLAYCVLNADWMGQLRFSTPVWPLAVLATAVCAARLVVKPGLRRRIGLVGSLAGAVYLAQGVTGPMPGESVAQPVAPLCVVADESGELFNSLADLAGVQNGSLLLPDLGGTALTSRLRLRDTAGLVDAKVADYLSAKDSNGLRDYIFDVMQPTFIQTHGEWSPTLMAGSGFDPRMLGDYAQIYPRSPDPASPWGGSEWVRKSALKDPADLAKLRDFAETAMPGQARFEQRTPDGDCSDRLQVGERLALH